MSDNIKIGAAALGGYLAGRTKKGKAAVRLALWLTGNNVRLRDALREQGVRLLQSEEGQQLLQQLRGPAMEAGRSAALAVYENQVGRLADGLHKRASKVTDSVPKGAGKVTGAAGRLVAKGRNRDEDQVEDQEEREPTARRSNGDRRSASRPKSRRAPETDQELDEESYDESDEEEPHDESEEEEPYDESDEEEAYDESDDDEEEYDEPKPAARESKNGGRGGSRSKDRGPDDQEMDEDESDEVEVDDFDTDKGDQDDAAHEEQSEDTASDDDAMNDGQEPPADKATTGRRTNRSRSKPNGESSRRREPAGATRR